MSSGRASRASPRRLPASPTAPGFPADRRCSPVTRCSATALPESMARSPSCWRLRQRDLTGEPQKIDLGLYEPLLSMMEDMIVDYDETGSRMERMGNTSPRWSPHGLFLTKDGLYAVIACSTEKLWRQLRAADGRRVARALRQRLPGRVAHRAEIEGKVSAWTLRLQSFRPARNLRQGRILPSARSIRPQRSSTIRTSSPADRSSRGTIRKPANRYAWRPPQDGSPVSRARCVISGPGSANIRTKS